MLNVELSRTERLERHAARLRDRGGIFVPAQRTGVLADILLGKRKLSPVKCERYGSRSRTRSCSPVRVASPQKGQGSIKPIKKADGSAKRKPRQSKATKIKTPKKRSANAKSATPSVVATGDDQGAIKVVKKTQRADKSKATKQQAKRTTTKSSKPKTSVTLKPNTKAKVSDAKDSEPAPLSVILEEDEDEFILTTEKTFGTTASVGPHTDDQTATPSKPFRSAKKLPAPAATTAKGKGKGKATDLVKAEDEPLKKVPTESATAKTKSKRSTVKQEKDTAVKKAATKSTAELPTASDIVDEKPKRKKRPLASDEDLHETKPVKRPKAKVVVKQESPAEEEPKSTKKGRKRDRETDDREPSQDPVPAPKRRRTKVEKDEAEPVKKVNAKPTRDAASKVKTVSKNKKENGATAVANPAPRAASKPPVKKQARRPPQIVLDRLKNAMPQIADDEPDEIDFLS